MYTLEERVTATEARIEWLETILERYIAHTDAMMRRLEQTDRNLEQTIQNLQRSLELDRKEWNKRWGELANRLGTIVEDIVAPSMPRIAQELGSGEIEDMMVRRQVRHKRERTRRREFDVVVVGEHKIVLNETKATVRLEYIDDFIQVLSEIDDYFPEYRGKPLVPVFASLYLADDIVHYLTQHRIYAMAMGDETMQLLNFEALKE